ncbi:MAG TPA: hypothetical protein DCS93_43495 [Microscillaceae bacterium]|nr:hypothetical protein [Microscillaceae bacterium]
MDYCLYPNQHKKIRGYPPLPPFNIPLSKNIFWISLSNQSLWFVHFYDPKYLTILQIDALNEESQNNFKH